ncbi:MAG: CotH kinase family protein [Bacteroidales bacterium]|nr:CotH kinase family protein [Bacteroidales bacterium]
MRRYIFIFLLILPLLVQAQILTDSNLPIVVINTDGGVTIPDEPKVLATMKIIWHQDGSRNYLTDVNNPEFLNYDGRIGIEIRGSSSQNLPKKPYGLETLQADDVTNNNVSILGMPKENDWVLNSLAFDQTGMRDVISYELSEKMGQYAPRRVYCEVVINNDYKGLYVFMEKIKADDNRVNIEKMDETCNSYPEVTGGYITKADKTTGNDQVAWTMQGYGNGWWGGPSTDFIHHYPKPDNITNAQHNYIKSVFFDIADKAGSHNTSIENGISSIIDIPSFVDFMMIAEFSSNVDVYSFSTFFHKDRKGKLRAGPVWDYNLTFGHDEFGNRSRYDVWQFDNNDNTGPKFWKDLFDTDMFRCLFAKRWFEITSEGNPLNYNEISSRMNEIDELITEAVGRDNQRWSKMTQHASEIQAMKTWIQQRINWLNQNIGSYNNCNMELPPLVISKIHYHPMDAEPFNGNQLEFIQIDNNSDDDIDLTGIYLRELGITYNFPNGSHLAARDALVLCSDSLAYIQYYNKFPFGEYQRKLSNKSEKIVLADAWGNVIDEVHYSDSEPWPTEPDGNGPYLKLIDLELDNSLAENWTYSTEYDNADEISYNKLAVFPNPANGMLNIVTEKQIISAEIIDLFGRIIARSSDNTINVSTLPNGYYNIRITTDEEVVVSKVCVIH